MATRPTKSTTRPNGNTYVQSLERGLAIIRSFGEQRSNQTLADVARTTGLDRATARRFLLTLQALGYIELDGRHFHLTPRTLDLGYAFLASLPWWSSAQRVVDRTATKLGRPCAVGVLDQHDVTYVAYATPLRHPIFQRTIGTKIPAYVTAIGRVLLAGLTIPDRKVLVAELQLVQLTVKTISDAKKLALEIDRVANDGYCVIDQELQLGLLSIGVPVFGRRGDVVAGLSISINDTRMKRSEIISNYLEELKAASASISESLPT